MGFHSQGNSYISILTYSYFESNNKKFPDTEINFYNFAAMVVVRVRLFLGLLKCNNIIVKR